MTGSTPSGRSRSVSSSSPAGRYEVPYPFVRDTYHEHTEDEHGFGSVERSTWRPGVRDELVYPDDSEMVADAMGHMLIEEVSRHKPGRFPERVFFVRRWRDPDGKEFGKTRCRMTTAHAFNRMTRGFRYEFRLAARKPEAEDTQPSEAEATP